MKFLLAVFFYLLQPVLWAGIIRTFLVYNNRLKRERSIFGSAIYGDFFEGRHFFRSIITLGIIGSILSLLFINISALWLIWYLIISLITLVVLPFQIFTVTSSVLASLLALNNIQLPQFSGVLGFLNSIGLRNQNINSVNYIIITTLIIILNTIFIRKNGGEFESPSIARNTRNNRIAVYRFNELSVIPLLCLVPGNWFTSHLSFWPAFSIHGQSFSLLFVPILLGLKMAVKSDVPRKFYLKLTKYFQLLALIGIIFTLICLFIPRLTFYALVVMLLGYYLAMEIVHHIDYAGDFEYSEVVNGVRVIGIQPGTPAAKMNLQIGDTILTVNGVSVSNEDEFYRALSKDSTYSRFRVLDRNNQLKLTEAAIFQNAPHEIGVKTYSNR